MTKSHGAGSHPSQPPSGRYPAQALQVALKAPSSMQANSMECPRWRPPQARSRQQPTARGHLSTTGDHPGAHAFSVIPAGTSFTSDPSMSNATTKTEGGCWHSGPPSMASSPPHCPTYSALIKDLQYQTGKENCYEKICTIKCVYNFIYISSLSLNSPWSLLISNMDYLPRQWFQQCFLSACPRLPVHHTSQSLEDIIPSVRKHKMANGPERYEGGIGR